MQTHNRDHPAVRIIIRIIMKVSLSHGARHDRSCVFISCFPEPDMRLLQLPQGVGVQDFQIHNHTRLLR